MTVEVADCADTLGAATAPASKAPRVALVEYHTAQTGTTIFLVTPDSLTPQVFEARDPETDRPVTADYLRDVARRLVIDFHGLPQGWDTRPDVEDFVRVLTVLPPVVPVQKRKLPVRELTLAKPAFQYILTYWERLSEALLPPKLKAALSDSDLLCIVPHGPLHALPFAALRWSPDKYLIERMGLVSVPSATVLRFCQRKNRARFRGDRAVHRPQSCFVAAVASAEDEDRSLLESDGETLTALFRSRSSSGRVTNLVGAGPKVGRQPASKALITESIGGHDVVHMACHGVFVHDLDSMDPLDSGLLVSDGTAPPPLLRPEVLTPEQRKRFLLTAREVFALDLQADLVTLRACSSGRAEVRSGDELLGLSRALLYAGAPSLLLTLWDVNQRSSRAILEAFYRRWLDETAPLPKWAALREAQLLALRDSDAHPYHWAPYVLVGDWL